MLKVKRTWFCQLFHSFMVALITKCDMLFIITWLHVITLPWEWKKCWECISSKICIQFCSLYISWSLFSSTDFPPIVTLRTALYILFLWCWIFKENQAKILRHLIGEDLSLVYGSIPRIALCFDCKRLKESKSKKVGLILFMFCWCSPLWQVGTGQRVRLLATLHLLLGRRGSTGAGFAWFLLFFSRTQPLEWCSPCSG